MNRIVNNYLNKKDLALILFLILVATLTFSSNTNAQARRGYEGRRGRRGGFITHMSRNFVHFSPRIGTRIRVLPFGYMSFWFGGIPYYYYDGIYYQYYPEDRTYAVVNKPAGVKDVSDLKFDQVRMNDGSTLEGVFEGATDSTITIKVGNKVHDINIGDIRSITFAPTIKDTTQQK